jgi:hypothetical protein
LDFSNQNVGVKEHGIAPGGVQDLYEIAAQVQNIGSHGGLPPAESFTSSYAPGTLALSIWRFFKRAGAVAALVFLDLNGLDFTAPEDDFAQMVLRVASGQMDKAELAVCLKHGSND